MGILNRKSEYHISWAPTSWEKRVNKILDIYNYLVFKQPLSFKQHPPYQLLMMLITPFFSSQNVTKHSSTWFHQFNYHFIALNVKNPGPVRTDKSQHTGNGISSKRQEQTCAWCVATLNIQCWHCYSLTRVSVLHEISKKFCCTSFP